MATGKTGRLNRCTKCKEYKRVDCKCPKQSKKSSSSKRIKRSKRGQNGKENGDEESEGSSDAVARGPLDLNSDCESGDEELQTEAKDVGESDSSSEDGSDEEETMGVSIRFRPVNVNIKDFDTSTLRSQSPSIETAKIFPTFNKKQSSEMGPKNIPKDIDTPLEYLQLFWDDDEIMDTLVTNTNSYGSHIRGSRWKNVAKGELWVFLSIVLFTGVHRIPNRRLLWDDKSGKYRSQWVKSLMNRDRFEEILRCLHWIDTSVFSDNEIADMNKQDCFWRVEELAAILAERFQYYYVCGQYLDGDEQGIPAKCYHSAIQYNGDKPHKYFFKLYSLNDSSSKYMHNFYLFRGKDSDHRAGISASALPIVKLTDGKDYHGKNHIMYVDNYFNSIALCEYLLDKRQIHVVGTLRSNRIPSSIVPRNWWFKKSSKNERGEMKSKQIDDDLFVTTWYDKKPVNMLHTFETTKEKVTRNSKNTTTKAYEQVDIERPTVVRAYNEGMGGTDSFDQRLAYYRPAVNTKKWPHRIIFHLLQCSIINAHIIYKEKNQLQKHDPLDDLFGFLDSIIDEITAIYGCEQQSDEEESELIENIRHNPVKRRRTVSETVSEKGHHVPYSLPAVDPKTKKANRLQCNAPGCKKKVSTFCSHCNVALCLELAGNENCWNKYHQL